MLHIVQSLLLVSLGASTVAIVLPKKWFGTLPFNVALIPVLFTAIDIVSGNWRWQMVPAYLLSVGLPVVAHFRARDRGPSGWRRKILFAGATVVGLVSLLVAVTLPLAYPMFDIPAPAGPHGVGIMDIHLVDADRGEDMTDDTAFLLDELAMAGSGRSAAVDAFAGRLDLDRVGLFGMSYGGAAAGAFCVQDERCTAGINMDGSQFGENSIEWALERPFMLMNADRRLDMGAQAPEDIDTSQPASFEINDFVYHQSKDQIYSLTVGGSTHGSYSDFGVMTRIGAWTGALGTVDGWAMKKILDDYTLAFFNKHVKGTEGPLLDGPSAEHPDVIKFDSRDGREPADEPSSQTVN